MVYCNPAAPPAMAAAAQLARKGRSRKISHFWE
jgi:hypothetical protein